jgi:Flp pilus assembly protein TadG
VKRRKGQRGSVAVEAAFVTPILVLLILGGLHFGKVLMLRHKLAAATDVATRTTAIAKLTITNLGVDSVQVEATCVVDTARFSSALTGFLGPEQLTVRVAMPM